MSGVTLSQNQAIPHDYGASKQIEGKETTEPLPVYNMSEFEGNFFAEEVYELSGLFFNRLANLDNLIHQLNGRLILYHPTYSHNFTDKYARLPIRQKLETRISASIKSGTYQNVLLSSPDTLFKDFVHTSYEGRYINQDRLVKAITTMEK